ncbi:pentapeptide repeat-containing protein [Pseudoalteromonas neustonica]|uniref:Pentapeptide repeat-containing protein n=1 Tax=Pseudoalteromonas neustonica TaxID=1840331 RepID=A0ABU9U165_9GAMM
MVVNDQFSQSDYYDQQFSKCAVNAQRFSNIEFEQCQFIECDFSDSQFSNCRFIECEFINCNLSDLNWGYSALEDVSFVDCKLNSIQWVQVNWPQLALTSSVSFKNCQLSHSSFYELVLKELTMTGCFAKDVDFRHANLAASNFSDTDFRDSLFHQTHLNKANFVGATNFNIDIKNNNVSNAKFERFEALNLLSGLDIELVD